jgi:hypothetical protein
VNYSACFYLPLVLLSALKAKRKLSRFWDNVALCRAARDEVRRESESGALNDHPIDVVVPEALEWLKRAQEGSLSFDGGIARDYTLGKGWGTSYPETTGYAIPTLIREAQLRNDQGLLARTRRMLDWLVEIQMPCGGYQGGHIGAVPVVPVTFNTGQIVLGLAAGACAFGEPYRTAMCRAADWLVSTQDADGCWRRHPTPFAGPGEKVYETHVAFGLLEAARVQPGGPYAEAAMRNVHWSLSHQASNGWLDRCCLIDPSFPLTHTLGYAPRGFVEAYRFSRDTQLLDVARKTADGILGALGSDGFLPGRLDSGWKSDVSWSCLTGTAQVAICWLLLYQETKDTSYRDAGYLANQYVRRTVRIDGPEQTRGAVKGSFPIAGEYCSFQYPNWACKFFIDANCLEKAIREEE